MAWDAVCLALSHAIALFARLLLDSVPEQSVTVSGGILYAAMTNYDRDN